MGYGAIPLLTKMRKTFSYRLLVVALTGASALAAFGQSADPEAILQSIVEHRKTSNAEAIEEAKKAVAGIDPTTVAPKDAYAWMQIFGIAGLTKEAGELSSKASQFATMRAWEAQQIELEYLLTQGQTDKVMEKLDFVCAGSIPMLGQIGEWVKYRFAPAVQAKNPQLALDAFDLILRRVDLKRPKSKTDQDWADFAIARITASRSQVLFDSGKQAEALATLKKLHAKYLNNQRCLDQVTEVENQLTVVSHQAPAIPALQTLGTYNGLAALKGKVVVLDFFAHWCGPCKRAFPEIRDLYAELKGKGLEVVGVTSYYGYYGAKQGLAKPQEYDAMKGFVTDFKITWPVAFTDGAPAKAYGVSAIPHVVVIDRKGVVRYMRVGVGPENAAALRKMVEKCLAEPE